MSKGDWGYKRDTKYEDLLGNQFPYIRIKDYIISKSELLEFELESSDFLPTATIHILTATKSLVQENAPVDGDRINIAFREDLKVFKSIASDFIIDSVKHSPYTSSANGYELLIHAILFVPNLDSDIISYNFYGKAEDALHDAAKRLGLGWVHTPDLHTKYNQTWDCYDSEHTFIPYVTKHMWLAKDSFFDSWIDPFRHLVCVNVNDLLGRKLADDGRIDYTKYKNILGTIHEDNKQVSDELTSFDEAKYPKLFTNIPSFENSMMFVTDYNFTNNSTAISKMVGAQITTNYYKNNNGVDQSEQDANGTIDIGVWYNQEKLDAGYVIANGPTNYTEHFESANNGSWKDQNTKSEPPNIFPVEADSDQDTNNSDQSNNKASGNLFKMFKAAEYHNYVNLMELEKQYVTITCNGANLGVAKGEKVPMILINKSNNKYMSHTMTTGDYSFMFDQKFCGWFYVKGIKWVYKPNNIPGNYITDWQTKIVLTRREWMPPEATATAKEAGDITIENNTATGDSISSISPDLPESSNNSNADSSSNSSLPQDNINNETELGGMTEETKENYTNFIQNYNKEQVRLIGDNGQSIVNNLGSITNNINAEITQKISNISTQELNELENKIKNTQKTVDSINTKAEQIQSTLNTSISNAINITNNVNTQLSQQVLDSVTNSAALIAGLGSSALDNVNNIVGDFKGDLSLKEIPNLINNVKSCVSCVSSIGNNLKNSALGNILGLNKNSSEIPEDSSISDVSTNLDYTKEELMAYDPNGLKHFMNIFIDSLNRNNISYQILASRRYAVDRNDQIVYGNAFIQKEQTSTYKTLDSDNKLYWFSDLDSRHYYGEAIDIIGGGSLSDLLESIYLKDDVLRTMHKFGICIQVEVSETGAAKGTHFHCSTEPNEPQTIWWGLVNKKHQQLKLPLYSIIINSEYYEEPTLNNVIIV